MTVEFGALAPKMIAQLPDPKRNRRTWLGCCSTWQQDADAITRLSIHGLITESERDRSRQRLLKTIAYFYKHHKFIDVAA